MNDDFPTARVRLWWIDIKDGLWSFVKLALKVGGIVFVASLAVGLAFFRPSCNDAVKYGETIYPTAKCEAVSTCYVSCSYDQDIAVCNMGDIVFSCTVGDKSSGCEQIRR